MLGYESLRKNEDYRLLFYPQKKRHTFLQLDFLFNLLLDAIWKCYLGISHTCSCIIPLTDERVPLMTLRDQVGFSYKK